ncbi:MAG: phospho-N-acetylmuramoyl-pentapeptide-transferase [Elusimicrobia bacterium]|nr:phospho-N-acetylmuramoyl-pentapeptide-transferase [Elusimicrobiota bacterium]
MLYYIFYPLRDIFFGFNVFRYISFRTIGAIGTSFLLVFFLIPKWIQYFKSKNFLSAVREDSLKNHHKKISIPTMGGVVLIPSIIFSSFCWMKLNTCFFYITTFILLLLGICGFLDDWEKLKHQTSKGISARTKLLFQIFTGLAIGIYLWKYPPNPEVSLGLTVPFFKDVFINLGALYILVGILILVASSNAVNLTDGLDGLAIGTLMICSLTFAILAYIAGNVKFSSYLGFPYIKDAGELTVFLGAILGGGLAFLWYNAYPAEIFMGDTGSLPLGGILGVIAILTKHEILLIVIGGIFVLEALSVILQVLYYKKTSRRIFKMAPLHHHFELKNWHESKVVIRFWIIGLFFMLLALITLKLR